MTENERWIIYVFVVYVGMADESSASDYMNDEVSRVVANNKPNKRSIMVVSLAVLVGVVGAVVLCILVYKRRQRKKKEAQQARLMKLFEPDEQLDQELSGNNTV